MPYRAGTRLPGERASRLGHLEVVKSPLVQELVSSFEDSSSPRLPTSMSWEPMQQAGMPLPLVFGVDGSFQVIESPTPPYKALGFVKTALFRIDQPALAQLDRDSPHPYALRDILTDSALYHATVFPLRHIAISGMSVYDAVRQTIFESVKDPQLSGEAMETLKWIAYEKWNGGGRDLPPFECPHCESQNATLPYNEEKGRCPDCGKELFITDMLGFHLEMAPDSAPDGVARDYMTIHETLLLFTGIRYFWEHNRDALRRSLFVKDGPLRIRAQYSKLVEPIRRFLAMARDAGIQVCVLGQEKSGAFADHLALIGDSAPIGSVFVPGHQYIREQIQHRPVAGAPYGKDTNYGAKVFVRLTDRHKMTLNIPTGEFVQDPTVANLIGAPQIFATLPTLLSSRYEDGLLPVELANAVASLSTYPSVQILTLFAESKAQGHAGKPSSP
ncbi:MAG: hypothetical protein DRI39_10020 [Chloroflexi bacterium]|nr:MAG: hypothetical protein DRI39_10020 [Chloroflexota bacterium]RLC96125.1 MAG: hypothetical protein DRI40_04055 [Chloroflexota bacterium]